ncbi:putative syntaxin [Trypanosoma theileri]|uniref:Putative syntaxin n=1 Tax=Trypanosoma theileri TaxID=67003 RepID=A0A1X0P6H2_9TRYP|nr:putative syntaxin [Trypanosoma theileri]ORC92527.1 putative syntaxin [Trypanosoma theileri]
MMEYIPNSDGLMRSTLRDTIKRIRRIRAKAGREDEKEEESTGDPLRDLSLAFIRCVNRAKEGIKERNEGVKQHGHDRMSIEQSNSIRKDLRTMETLLEEMKKFVDTSETALAKENKKKKPSKRKLGLLEKQRDERAAQYKECLSTLELVRELDIQYLPSEKKEVDLAQETQLGRKAQLREQLLTMRRPRKGENNHVDPNGDFELQDLSVGGGRLQDQEETKEAMKTIAAQDAKIDAGLDRLKAGVGRLQSLATEIGAQLDMQNQMLDKTEHKMDSQMKQIRNINRRLGKMIKETKPMNTFMNVCCIVLIIALVGFFLVQFNVI